MTSAPRNDNNEPTEEQRTARSRGATDAPPSTRLQKLLARAGIASRRHAEDMIVAGRVRVNGVVVDRLGTRVDAARDAVTVDGRRVSLADGDVYLALNKPAGYVTTAHDPQGRPTVMELVPKVAGLFPVGRLDYASEGLLLFTTDGEWAERVGHPRHGSTKEYLVEVEGRTRPTTLARLRAPMALGDGESTTGADVRIEGVVPDRTLLRVILHEGRNRQIRRMLDKVGHPVIGLVRVRVDGVALGALRPGQWRRLSHAEIATAAGASVPPGELSPAAGARRRSA